MKERIRNAFFSIGIIFSGITIPVVYHSQGKNPDDKTKKSLT